MEVDTSTSSDKPNLWCIATTGDETSSNEIPAGRELLIPEEGKKSAFLFTPETPLTILKPAHLRIEFADTSQQASQLFFLGGFQAITNAKQLEVYFTDKNGKEEYLTTSRGILLEKGENGEEWHKTVCVIPGGPRPCLGLHIKLLSLRPTDEKTNAQVKMIKVTARIPEIPIVSSDAAKVLQKESSHQEEHLKILSNNGTQQLPQTRMMATNPTTLSNPDAITQADLGAAMASLSIIARSTEDGIEKVMSEKFDRLESFLHTRLRSLEQHVMALTSIASAQQAKLDVQTKLLEIQQSQMKEQAEQIQNLLAQQQLLSKVVMNVQTDVSCLRQPVRVENNTMAKNEEKLRAKRHTLNTVIEDEPIEGGIEHTLSNLDIDGHDDDDDDDNDEVANHVLDDHNESTDDNHRNSVGHAEMDKIEVEKVLPPRFASMAESTPAMLDESETIEVSLLDGAHEPILGLVHDGSNNEALSEQSSHCRFPKSAPSFEDRNDKNDTKGAAAPDIPGNVELEVMTGHDDKAVEVVESTTADEHERSPPDVATYNLIDL